MHDARGRDQVIHGLPFFQEGNSGVRRQVDGMELLHAGLDIRNDGQGGISWLREAGAEGRAGGQAETAARARRSGSWGRIVDS